MDIKQMTGAAIVIVAGLLPGALLAEEAQTPSERYQELVKEKGAFQETWVLPGLNMADSRKVYLWEASFQYRDVGPARRHRSMFSTGSKQAFGMSDEDRKWFEDNVLEAFDKEFAKGKNFEIVDEIGPNTLVLRGGLADIISKVPPEFVGRSEIYLASVGAATFVLELVNASNGEVVAMVAERRAMQTLNAMTGYVTVQSNKVTVRGDVKRWSTSLARRLRNAMDKAIKEDSKAG